MEIPPIKSIETTDRGTAWRFDGEGTGRNCGTCQLCCKLVPVPPLHKPAGTRCQHSRAGKGCAIYASRPRACRVWSCRWLVDPETDDMPRPDRAHYVIDLNEDYVSLREDATGKVQDIRVIQVWIDPAFRAVAEAPALRAYMARLADRYHIATILRFSSTEAVTVFPPAFDTGGEWHTLSGRVVSRTAEERAILTDFKEG